MIAEQVTEALESAGVQYEVLEHGHAESARGEARALGVSASAVAKTIVLATPTGHVRAMVPASGRLDLRKVRSLLGVTKHEVRLLGEAELGRDYPEFELGAVPPLGGPHADRVLIDSRLTKLDHVVFSAGSHDTSLRLATADLVRLTGAHAVDICQEE